MDALRPVKPWRTKAPVRIRPSGIAALGATKTRGNAGTLLNATTTAKAHMAEIHAMELEPKMASAKMATVVRKVSAYVAMKNHFVS